MRIDIPGKGPIQFEGTPLPEAAKQFDEASFFRAISKEGGQFLLDLRYAWGRQRQAPSELVLRTCDEVESRIRAKPHGLFGIWKKWVSQPEDRQPTDEWLAAIQIMREAARVREVCRWTVVPVEGEGDFWLKQSLGFIRCMEKAQNKTMFPPGFLDKLKSAPDEEKIQFLVRTTDAVTDE